MSRSKRSLPSVCSLGPPNISSLDTLTRIRQPWFRLIATLYDEISRGTYQFFGGVGLRTVPLPFATSSVASPIGLGSDSLPLPARIAGQTLYLPDSMQFGLEYGCRFFDKGCFCLFPSFRGDRLDRRHLRHYYHAEAEIPGEFDDAISLAEKYIRFLTQRLSAYLPDIARLIGDTSHIEAFVVSPKIPRLTLREACAVIPRRYVQSDKKLRFQTLTENGEQFLLQKMGGPVWLVDLDHLSVPFYQAFAQDGTKTAKAADLLMGIGEVVGLGERHSNVRSLRLAMKLHKLRPTGYQWYLKMKKRFPMRTSGFGVGIERYLCWLLRRENVWDCQLLPKLRDGRGLP